MTKPNSNHGTTDAESEQPAKKPAAARTVLVLDTTATPESGPRKHELIVQGAVKTFTFDPGKPTGLPPEIAAKFLRHEAFKLVNAKGEVQEYRRRPKQPDELEAGETIELSENETIAHFDELSSAALFQRALEMPGGEKFARSEKKPDRAEMIAFIKSHVAARAKANQSRERDIGADEFVPELEPDEEAAAA